jgi:hypothetical protein
MTAVHSHLDVFDERNAFLQVALGLVAACRQALELVVAEGPTAEPPVVRADDPVLDAALGLASLASAVLNHMHELVDAGDAGSAADVMTATASAQVELRSLLV